MAYLNCFCYQFLKVIVFLILKFLKIGYKIYLAELFSLDLILSIHVFNFIVAKRMVINNWFIPVQNFDDIHDRVNSNQSDYSSENIALKLTL